MKIKEMENKYILNSKAEKHKDLWQRQIAKKFEYN